MRPIGSAPSAVDRPAPAGGSSRSGFGLIEAIVALAIAGLVLAAVTELAGRTLRSWDRGFATVTAVERTDVGLGRLATDLTALLPIPLATADDPSVLFAGDDKGFAFTALTPLGRAEEGIAIVEIAVEGTAQAPVLVRKLRRAPDLPLRDGDRVALLGGKLEIAFAYRDHAGQRTDRWSRPGEVPRGVIVTLKGDRSIGGGLPSEILLPIPVDISVSCLMTATDAGSADKAGNPTTTGPTDGNPSTGGRTTPPQTQPQVDPPSGGADARAKRCGTGPNAQKPNPPPGEGTAPGGAQ